MVWAKTEPVEIGPTTDARRPYSVSTNSAHAFQASQLFFSCALASSKVATRSDRAMADDGQRPEPAEMIGTAARLVDAADCPVATEDRVVGPVLVDPGPRPVGASSAAFWFALPTRGYCVWMKKCEQDGRSSSQTPILWKRERPNTHDRQIR